MINYKLRNISMVVLGSILSFVIQTNVYAAGDEDKDIGLGGTGMQANSNGGLGGTGIVGEITGFGSIFVNGIEIEHDEKTEYTVNAKPSIQPEFSVGDVVEVLTSDANTYTYAKIINIRHELIGKVESVEPQTFSFTVLGQTVVQAINNRQSPKVGDTVAVSGVRIDEKTILASRVIKTEVQKNYIRQSDGIPFQDKTSQWRIQTHVRDNKTSFKFNNNAYKFELQQSLENTVSSRSKIRIVDIEKSTQGEIRLNQVIDSKKMPRGRKTLDVINEPGLTQQHRIPNGTYGGNTNGSMPGSIPGAIPGVTPGNTKLNGYRIPAQAK